MAGSTFAASKAELSAIRGEKYAPPQTVALDINFDRQWKFIREDAPDAQAVGFDDAKWQSVSTPHTYNDIDTFNKIISHGGGQAGAYMGLAWYRKHFKLPAEANGQKVFIEFEGMRQAGEIFLNGKSVGLSENGVTAYGIDLSDSINFDGKDNVLAVKIDNSSKYQEKASGSGFEWESKDFNPDYGGITSHVLLHVMGKIHQTLPIYYGLETTGQYIYPSDISVSGNSATINVESQVRNESGDQASMTMTVVIVDPDGKQAAKFDADAADLVNKQTDVIKCSGKLTDAKWWSPDHPVLYTVYTILNVDGKPVDVRKSTTGFRKADYRGGVGTGGVYINDKFVYLTGYAQRSSDEWAGLGQAYPDWMHDFTMKLLRESNGNYLRWMHISPRRVDVEACDRAGVVEVCPAGDKEKDVEGRQWEQRMEVMRDSMIYFRNNPSIFFWEAGNNGISADHMKQMVDLKAQWDPSGQRVMGCRTLSDPKTTPVAEYFGVMLAQDAKLDARKTPEDIFRGYNDVRRDRVPFIETEDFRDEGARRFWDEFSPPHFGFKPGPNDTYHWNSETFALAASERYWAYYSNRISNKDPAHSHWSGYASIYFADSNADGRQDSSEVARVSGKVDAVRLPKEIYFAQTVMQSTVPAIHIIGHWSYPAATKKTMYVFANHVDAVELQIDGQKIGEVTSPTNGYVYAFANVAFKPGKITAIGKSHGQTVCKHEFETAGPAVALKLTPTVGPDGMKADGADIALFDIEAVDADGRRCPTDEARVDFDLKGPGIWRGGYNSGVVDATNKTNLLTEDGINRVAVKATFEPGTITLTASRSGLKSATASVDSH